MQLEDGNEVRFSVLVHDARGKFECNGARGKFQCGRRGQSNTKVSTCLWW